MDGMRQVWEIINVFLSALPTEVIMIATFAFIGAVIIGLFGWLK